MPSSSPAISRKTIHSDLSHLHWKQRQKRLAEIAREQEMLGNGITPSEPSSQEILSQMPREEKSLNLKERESIESSASYWNSLLVQARKARGPQWDYSTQQHLYDRRSKDYYTLGKSPPPSPTTKKRKISIRETSMRQGNASVDRISRSSDTREQRHTHVDQTNAPFVQNAPSIPTIPITNTSHISHGRPTSSDNPSNSASSFSNDYMVTQPLPVPGAPPRPLSRSHAIHQSAQNISTRPSAPAPANIQVAPAFNPALLASLPSFNPSQTSALHAHPPSSTRMHNGMMLGSNGLPIIGGGTLSFPGQHGRTASEHSVSQELDPALGV
ncbi:hypothetical protein L204_100455 [Cryptococcus depauperatus]|nr:hypothetical protein L204_06495 [Cryptococcus depauperatus CBS 7855]